MKKGALYFVKRPNPNAIPEKIMKQGFLESKQSNPRYVPKNTKNSHIFDISAKVFLIKNEEKVAKNAESNAIFLFPNNFSVIKKTSKIVSVPVKRGHNLDAKVVQPMVLYAKSVRQK